MRGLLALIDLWCNNHPRDQHPSKQIINIYPLLLNPPVVLFSPLLLYVNQTTATTHPLLPLNIYTTEELATRLLLYNCTIRSIQYTPLRPSFIVVLRSKALWQTVIQFSSSIVTTKWTLHPSARPSVRLPNVALTLRFTTRVLRWA